MEPGPAECVRDGMRAPRVLIVGPSALPRLVLAPELQNQNPLEPRLKRLVQAAGHCDAAARAELHRLRERSWAECYAVCTTTLDRDLARTYRALCSDVWRKIATRCEASGRSSHLS